MSELVGLFGFGPAGWGDELLAGMATTTQLAVAAFAVGTTLGLLGASAKLSENRTLRFGADAYTTVVRGVPEILIIFLLFYGGASALRQVLEAVGQSGPVEINGFLAGVVALAFVNGAYSTELFRGAILAVPRGQIEAARAVGMHRWLILRRILLPQVFRYALPGLGNLWLVMLKDTSLVSVIGLTDLLRIGFVASGSTRQPFTFYLAVAVLYLMLTVVSMVVLQRLERHLTRGERWG